MNWNEELMSSVRPVIDQAFRGLLDKSVEQFKAEAAQAIKEALRDLNHVLKSKFIFDCNVFIMLTVLYMTPRRWLAMPTRFASQTTSSATNLR
jgi:glutathione S-transferase